MKSGMTFESPWLPALRLNVVFAMLLILGLVGCQTPPESKKKTQEPDAFQQENARILAFGTLVFRSTHMTYPDPDESNNSADVYRFQPRVAVLTDRIAAIPGNRFGFLFEITDLPPNKPVRLKRVVRHPPRRLRNGGHATETVDEFPLMLPPDGIIRGYAATHFQRKADMLPGEWSVEVWHENKKLLAKKFTVFSTRPEPVDPWHPSALEMVWGQRNSRGIQVGLGSSTPGTLSVKIRIEDSSGMDSNKEETAVHPCVRILVRGAGPSWMPLKLLKPPAKEESPNPSAFATLDPEGFITVNLDRLGTNALPICLSEYEWPIVTTAEVALRAELTFDSPHETNGWQSSLNSGTLILPTTAISASHLAASLVEAGPVSANILEFGTFRPEGVTQRVLHEGIANRALDQHQRVVFLKRTEEIPGTLNTSFGYRFEITGLVPGSLAELKHTTTHPPIHAPDGRIVTQFQTHSRRLVRSDGTVSGFMGYGFDEEYEIVPGKWLMEVFLDGERLLQKSFEVLKTNADKQPDLGDRESER